MTKTGNPGARDVVVAGFAQWVATRDELPRRPADFYTPEVVQQRIQAGVTARLGPMRVERRQNLARLFYALMQEQGLSLRQLAAAIGVQPDSAANLLEPLRAHGLLTATRGRRGLVHGLSRAGEDWLLPVVDPPGWQD